MSKARLIITAVVLENRRQAEVARSYGVSESWVSKLVARYRAEGDLAFEPRSRRPHTSPTAIPTQTIALILELRNKLTTAGLDAGPDTIAWHLTHHHQTFVSVSTISRYLTQAGLVIPEPKKRPKSSYIRFQAQMPNETWQSDFTHYRLRTPPTTSSPGKTVGADVEIITWLDDCTRYALHVSAHHRVTGPIVTATFRKAAGQHGIPASTLTDNGMVYTVRLAGRGRAGGRNEFEHQLHNWQVIQKNSRPNHPTTCGKVERFQQSLKKWLHAQPDQPDNLTELQTLIDRFVDEYNHRRPHRALPHQATPAAAYQSMPKAVPGEVHNPQTHDRIRHDRIDKSGSVTLRVHSKLRHIGVGRNLQGTHVILLVQDLNVRVVNAITGELLRELTIDTTRDYQPRNTKDPNPQ